MREFRGAKHLARFGLAIVGENILEVQDGQARA